MARLVGTTSMAVTVGLSATPSPTISSRLNSSSLDLAAAELGHLLHRLQRTLLHADAERERRLRTSEFERARVEANLDHARKSLTKLEQDALGIKAPGRRLEVQGNLDKKRELLEQLVDRLEDLRKVAVDDEDDDASSGDEDILSEIIPTPSESMESASAKAWTESSHEEETPDPPPLRVATKTEPSVPTQTSPPEAPQEPPKDFPTQTSQTLRSRGAAPSPTPSSHSTARAALFANRRRPSPAEAVTTTATAEAILDQQRAEQDSLSEAILKMAGALKDSSHKFSDTLESDKEVVNRAGEGIEKTERGMEAARGRMGTLRRMTEGKGWLGRVILYAWVYGLMVALILLVFVMPKLRF